MKKLFASLLLMAAACFGATAQSTLLNNPDNKAYFGVRVGGEVTCPGDVTEGKYSMDLYNNGGGFEFGGVYNLPIVANLYIEPGLKLYYNTYSFNNDLFEDLIDDPGSLTVKKFGMRIPVMAGYHFDFTENIKVYVFTGPELEIGFTAKATVKDKYEKYTESMYAEDGGLHRVDLSWGIGAGVSYKNYYFGVSGDLGMLNMYKDSSYKFHENRVTFSLGYNF